MTGENHDFTAAACRLAGLAGAMLGWPPDIFWAATPDDVAHAFAVLDRGEAGAPPAGRDALARLQEQFPDG